VLWNTGAERLFGWSAVDAMGRPISELGLATDGAPDALAMTQRAFSGSSWEGTIPVMVKSGAMVLARIRSAPLLRPDQTVGGIIIQAHDTLYTPDSQLRMAARIAVLSSAGSRLGASLDVEATLDAIAELLVPGLADHCIVDLYDEASVLRRRQVVNVPGFDDADAWIEIGGEVSYPSSHPRAGTGCNQPVLIDSESVDIDVFAGTPKIANIYRRLGIRSIIASPAGRAREPGEAARDPDARRHQPADLGEQAGYDADDIDLAETLARRAGLALDNARLFTRQRNLALTLQQQLLPSDLPRSTVSSWRCATARRWERRRRHSTTRWSCPAGGSA
jgi:PAS domain S-box-containing protein